MKTTEIERFWSKVDTSNGPDACWPWLGSRNDRGYSQFRTTHPRRVVKAHRYAYEVTCGSVPPEHEVHHDCRNRSCCNPRHLTAHESARHRGVHTEQLRLV